MTLSKHIKTYPKKPDYETLENTYDLLRENYNKLNMSYQLLKDTDCTKKCKTLEKANARLIAERELLQAENAYFHKIFNQYFKDVNSLDADNLPPGFTEKVFRSKV